MKVSGKRKQDWLTSSAGAAEISQSLAIGDEAAAMTLYGLCATGRVRSCDKHGKLIDAEECTINDFENKAADALVSANDVRHWLSDWSQAPQPLLRDAAIEARLKTGDRPGLNIPWKAFCNRIRDECGGWRAKGKPAWRFGDKQIQRVVKALRQR